MPRNAAVAVDDELQSPPPKRRKNLPPVRSTRHDLDTTDHQIGQDAPRILRATGPAEDSLDAAQVEPIEKPLTQDKVALLAFMEEVLTVVVHDTTNPAEEDIVEVWNGGIVQRFPRGVEHKVRRKYVEVLARAKHTRYTQRKLPDNAGYENVPHTALRYPFTVVSDPSGDKGKAWLKAILQEA